MINTMLARLVLSFKVEKTGDTPFTADFDYSIGIIIWRYPV